MHQRGQVTVFIVVGIVVIIITGMLYYLVSTLTAKPLRAEEAPIELLPIELAPVKQFVENCLEKSVIDGIYHTLQQGGYNALPIGSKLFEFTEREQVLQLPYYFYDEKPQFPSLEEIETETADAAAGFFLSCIDEFTAFKSYSITAGDPHIELHFAAVTTTAQLQYPMTVKKLNTNIITSLKTFSATIPFNFREKHAVLEQYLRQQAEDPGYFLVGELSLLASEKGYRFQFDQSGEQSSTVIVSLEYDENLKEDPVKHNFALGYDWRLFTEQQEEVTAAEPSLLLEFMDPWHITESGINTYQVRAQGKELVYQIDPESLSISSEGRITLNTAEFANDEYLYYVIVGDQEGQQVAGPLNININVNPGNFPVIKDETLPVAAFAGQPFYYKMQMENHQELALFTDQSYLFDIEKRTGEIRFTPSEEDKGIHSIRIDAENEFGRTWKRWGLEIR